MRKKNRSASTRMATYIFFVVYGLLSIAFYHSSHRGLPNWWKLEDYTYCYLIPFIVLYLIWEKRDELDKRPSLSSWSALLPILLAIFFYLLGELGGEFYTLYLSSWFLLVGLCWLHMGWQKLKIIIFPLCFVLVMFPMPSFVYNNVSLQLKLISSKLGVAMLQIIGMTAYREGNVIDLGFTKLQVVDACSGLRYLIPLIVLGILVAYFFKASFWKKATLVLSTVPISILTNSLRIASVGFLYQFWGPVVAEGFFHDFSGWFIFMFSLAILMLEMEILKRIFPTKPHKNKLQSSDSSFPDTQNIYTQTSSNSGLFMALKQPHFWVVVICLGATLTMTQGINFRENIPISQSLRLFPLQLSGWSGTSQPMEQEFIDELDFSDYTIIDYKNSNGRVVNFYVAYYESQRKGESIHSPATCLPGGGWVFHKSGTVSIPFHGTTINVNRALMQKGNSKQLIYYWFPQRGRNLTNIYQLKFFAFWDALTRQRTDGSLVRLITPIYDSQQEAEKRLQQFSGDVIPTLNTFLPQ